jgi:hypothetical protein
MAGIGSPKGVKQGGRAKGTGNKATAAKAKAIEESGLTPLQYMINVMRKESGDPNIRLDAAKAAAPYVHPKLATTDINLKGKLVITELRDIIIDPQDQ